MGKVFAYLFFAVFSVGGVAAFYFSGFDMAVQSIKARSWESVNAELISYDLDSSRSSDTTTYKAMATYSYQYLGVSYTSRQVGFSKGYDNISSYHHDMHQRLAQISRNSEPFQVWVNPDQPTDAVIDRDIRWASLLFGSIFLLLFGGVGFGGICFTYATRNNGEPLAHSDPTKPWTEYREWNSPTKLSNAKLSTRFWLGFALFWNILSLGGLVVAIDEVMKGNYLALLVLLFPLVGVFLAWTWYKAHRSFKLTGLMPLELDPFPGSIGGQVGGTISLSNRNLQKPKNLKIQLFCIHQYQQKSGKETKTKERVLWEQSMVPRPRMGATGYEFSFSFDAPDNLSVPDPPLELSRNLWRLSFIGESHNGIKIERDYEDIPVFATGEKSSFRDQDAYAATSTQTLAAQHRLVESVLDVEQDARGYKLNYPIFSNKVGLGILMFGLVFIGSGVLIPSLIFNIIFPLIGAIVFLCGANMFLSALDVRIGVHGITSQKSLLGFKLKEKFIPSYGLKGFVAKESYSVGSGTKMIHYFKLEAHGSEGEKIVVAKKLKWQDEVEAAIAKFEALTKGYQ